MPLTRRRRRSWTPHVAAFAHKIGPAQLGRLIEEAKARFDPEQTEAERHAAAEPRHFDLELADAGVAGTVRIDGEVDLADALDLEAAIAADAHHQLLLGSTESLDVRRSLAAGNLARGQQHPRPRRDRQRAEPRREREVVLHVHLEHAAVLGAGGLARVQETRGPITAEQVREWCANPDTNITVQPVLDLAEHLQVGSYEASARLKLQTQLRDGTCVSRSASAPPKPATANTASRTTPTETTRTHLHLQPRALLPTTSPRQDHRRLDLRHRRTRRLPLAQPPGLPVPQDHTGTLDVTPDEERLRLAHEFRAHFGDTDPADPEP